MSRIGRTTSAWWAANRGLTFWQRWHTYYLGLAFGVVIGLAWGLLLGKVWGW